MRIEPVYVSFSDRHWGSFTNYVYKRWVVGQKCTLFVNHYKEEHINAGGGVGGQKKYIFNVVCERPLVQKFAGKTLQSFIIFS